MKSIVKYQSVDGVTWDIEEKARHRDILVEKVAQVMAPLGETIQGVRDGHGWIQHDPAVVLKAKQGILDLCKEEFAEAFPAFNQPAEKVHPLGIVGRILDDAGNDPRSTAWCRFCRIDEQGREHQQTYFAYTAGPEPAHICLEDRRKG